MVRAQKRGMGKMRKQTMIVQRDTQALLVGLGPSVHAPLLTSAEWVTTPTENLDH